MHTPKQIISLFLLFAISITGPLTAGESSPDWVPKGFDLVYQENFTSPDSIDNFLFTSPGDWKRVKDGDRYALEQNKSGSSYDPPVRSPQNIGMINNLQVGSFILDFHVNQHGNVYPHQDACVFFNIEDPSNFYYVHIGAKRDNVAYQIHNVDDGPRTAITKNQDGDKGLDWSKQKWHHVRVIRNAKKGHIAIYINDMSEPAMLAKDTSHQMGYIGFGSFDDRARFTNIRIWAPEKKEVPADFYQPKKK
jgi:hypothetical protein